MCLFVCVCVVSSRVRCQIALTAFPLLPPFSGDAATTKKHLSLARETLELACFSSLRSSPPDVVAFVRHVTQLRMYYQDYSALLPPSPNEAALTGAWLLSLLSRHQLAEFHADLELLTHRKAEIVASPHVQFAQQVEQQLMEGCYNQVLASSSTSGGGGKALPCPESGVFMRMLSSTVRDKIAECVEVAYQELPSAQAKQLLQLQDDAALRDFVKARAGRWTLGEKDGVLRFPGANADAEHGRIPTLTTIAQTLAYATEVEKIV